MKTLILKISRTVLLLSSGILSITCANAQFFFNNGAEISVQPGAFMRIGGSVANVNSGIFENQGVVRMDNDFTNNSDTYGNGDYLLAGNWTNNGLFICGNSNVLLEGGSQIIGGNIPTFFNNLELTGSGIKSLSVNSHVTGVLSLNDRELATGNFVMSIENVLTNALTRTVGFVSSLGNGSLSRRTNANAVYLFPVGSSSGSLRYRPVEVTPADASVNTYCVRFANSDATTEGFDRSALQYGICVANPLFFHLIDRTAGVSQADISVYFDPLSDGNWVSMANWQLSPTALWKKISPVVFSASAPLNSLTHYNWNSFGNKAFILTNLLKDASINQAGPFCGNNKPVNLIAADTGGVWYGQGVVNSTSGVFSPSLAGSGIHQIIYTIGGTCGNSDTVSIVVNQVATLSANIIDETCIDEGNGSIGLLVNGGSPGYLYNWNGGQFSTANINGLSPGTYQVSVTDSKGCVVTGSFEVYSGTEPCKTPHVFVPNVFSPNGDGKNDKLYVRGEGISYLAMAIYNRWGEKIFETDDINVGWNGKYKGKELNSGVFVYYLKAEFSNGKRHANSGTITLVR